MKKHKEQLIHNHFDISFVTIDQILLFLWHLKCVKYPFNCCNKSYIKIIVIKFPFFDVFFFHIWTMIYTLNTIGV